MFKDEDLFSIGPQVRKNQANKAAPKSTQTEPLQLSDQSTDTLAAIHSIEVASMLISVKLIQQSSSRLEEYQKIK